MDWFLYDNGLCHERVKPEVTGIKCHRNSIIKMSYELKVAKHCKRRKSDLNISCFAEQ